MSRLMVVVSMLLLGVASTRADDHGENADQYSTEQFKEKATTSPHFVMFYAPWCGHCKRLAPTLDQLGTKYNKDGAYKVATVAKVDCTIETALCSDMGVTGYPTLKFFSPGKDAKDAEKYRGSRDYDALDKYITEQAGAKDEGKGDEDVEVKASPITPTDAGLYELTGEAFKPHVATGYHFIKFYAPWCGHCKKLAPTWDDLAKSFKGDKQIRISNIDCTQHGATCQDYEVRGYPTLLFFKNGEKIEKYAGSRELSALRDYVVKKSGVDPNAGRTDEKVPEKTAAPAAEAADGLSVLTVDSFAASIAGKPAFIKFYAPWCGHCKRLAPAWDDLAKVYKDSDVVIGKVDCTTDRQVCTDHDVKGYPTLLYFTADGKYEKYARGRELDSLKAFVAEKTGAKSEPEPAAATEKGDAPTDNVAVLTDDSFEESIADGVKFVMFYAPWCGHCKNLGPTWKDLATSFQTHPDVTIAKVDCTTEKKVCKEEEVNGFPTLILYRNGEDIAEYEGARSLTALKEFILTKVAEVAADDQKRDEL